MWYEQVHSEPVPAWFMVRMQRHSHPFASLAVTFKSYLGAAPTAFCHSCTWRSLREHDLLLLWKETANWDHCPMLKMMRMTWNHRHFQHTNQTKWKGAWFLQCFPWWINPASWWKKKSSICSCPQPASVSQRMVGVIQLFLCSDWREERERLRETQRDSERLRETQRDSERLRETQRDSERLREAQRGSERLREAQRGSERLREAQRDSERLRETQKERERETCVFNVVCGDCSGLSQKQDYVQSTTSRPQRLCQQRTPANSQSTLNSWMAGMWCLACL